MVIWKPLKCSINGWKMADDGAQRLCGYEWTMRTESIDSLLMDASLSWRFIDIVGGWLSGCWLMLNGRRWWLVHGGWWIDEGRWLAAGQCLQLVVDGWWRLRLMAGAWWSVYGWWPMFQRKWWILYGRLMIHWGILDGRWLRDWLNGMNGCLIGWFMVGDWLLVDVWWPMVDDRWLSSDWFACIYGM